MGRALRALACVAAVGILAVVPAAVVQAQTDPATLTPEEQEALARTLTDANAAFDEGRYPEALAGYDDVLRRAEFSEVHYRRAICLEKLGRIQDARQAHADYLRTAPDAVDRGRIEAEIARLDALLDARSMSRFSIQSDPAGATVHLGDAQGRVLGVTPAETALPAGTYTFYFELDGYEPRSTRVVGTGGEAVAVQLTLARPQTSAPPQVVVTDAPVRTAAWGWGAVATGGALAVSSGLLWFLAEGAYQDANRYERGDSSHTRKELESMQADGAAFETGFWVSGVSAVALLSLGAVLVWVDDDGNEQAFVAPGLAAFQAGVRF